MPLKNKWIAPALIYLTIQNIILLIINIVTVLAGLFLVPIGLFFLVDGESVSDKRPIRNMPKWLWIWGNDADGANGDRRLWWDKKCDELAFWGIFPHLRSLGYNVPTLNSNNPFAQYWWLAVRNPSNNLRFIPFISCPLEKCVITYFGDFKVKDKLGFEGWQLVLATHKESMFIWMGLYIVIKYKNSNNGLRMRLGFKVEPDDNYYSEPKSVGFAISILPNKDLT